MVSMGRNLHPNTAAGIEAGLSLIFSDEKLNLKGEKKICPWNSPPADNFSGNPLSYEKFELKKKKERKKKRKKKRNSAYYNFFFLWLNYYKSTSNGSDTVLLKYFTPPHQAQAASRERVDSPTSAQASGDGRGRYCWALAAAGTGIPRGLAAAITGEPARGPRGEGVGTEEIPESKQPTVS